MDGKVKKVCNLFKQTLITLNINFNRTYLFGSRVKGTYNENSDYDFLIITNNISSKKERIKKQSKISLAMAKLGFYIDVFVVTQKEYEKYKNWTCHVVREVEEGGVLC